MNDDLLVWGCPECSEGHEDEDGTETHCRNCGAVVIVSEPPVFQGWFVELVAVGEGKE